MGAAFDATRVIGSHSTALADAAEGHLGAAVTHCPGWRVADLVAHVTEVQWFWAEIVAGSLDAPPDERRRPPRAADADLVAALRTASARLVDVLGAADPGQAVWTWAPAGRDVAFVLRHQVQEAAVHHWDALEATGASRAGTGSIEPVVAADAVDEFLTFSVSSDADPADPTRPALGGRFALHCTDTGDSWGLTDGAVPGTVAVTRGAGTDGPVVAAPAPDLLLWLYGRVGVPTGAVDPALLGRFRALCFTD